MDILGNGAGPLPAGSPGGGSSCYPLETFETQTIDLTQPISGLEIIPARPFYSPHSVTTVWIVEQVTGTQTSPPTIRAGNDANHDNLIGPTSTTPSNANVNAAQVPCPITGPGTGAAIGPTSQFIANAPVFLDVTAGAAGTGGFTLKARLAISVSWSSVSG